MLTITPDILCSYSNLVIRTIPWVPMKAEDYNFKDLGWCRITSHSLRTLLTDFNTDVVIQLRLAAHTVFHLAGDISKNTTHHREVLLHRSRQQFSDPVKPQKNVPQIFQHLSPHVTIS